MIKATRKFVLPLFLICIITGNLSGMASLCAGFPFVFPVLYDVSGISQNRLIQSAILGVAGIIASFILMYVFGIYSTKSWLVPALAGFSMCCIYFKAFIKVPNEKHFVIRFFSILFVIITCMYI